MTKMSSDNNADLLQLMRELNTWQQDVVERLARIETQGSVMPKMTERVENLEASHNTQKGVIKTLGALWTLLMTILTWHLTKGNH